jgi:hypothetical protein
MKYEITFALTEKSRKHLNIQELTPYKASIISTNDLNDSKLMLLITLNEEGLPIETPRRFEMEVKNVGFGLEKLRILGWLVSQDYICDCMITLHSFQQLDSGWKS